MNLFHNIDEVLSFFSNMILSKGRRIETRDLETREIFPVSFILENPSNRCVVNPIRKWSLPLALGEWVWHLKGRDSIDDLTYYAKSWKNFSDGERVIDSCYGKKVFEGPDNQWKRLVKLLKCDPHSRRAVLSFYDHKNGLDEKLIDVACTVSIQFLLREGKLCAITYMRSNDLILGVPYDIFFFTMLQEMLAIELGVQCGPYYHQAGSLHIYKRHYNLAESIRDARFNDYYAMPEIKGIDKFDKFSELENSIRVGEDLCGNVIGERYWDELVNVLQSFSAKKKGNYSHAKNLLDESDYKRVMAPTLP